MKKLEIFLYAILFAFGSLGMAQASSTVVDYRSQINIIGYDVYYTPLSGFGGWEHKYNGTIEYTGVDIYSYMGEIPEPYPIYNYTGGSGTLNDSLIGINESNTHYFVLNWNETILDPVIVVHLENENKISEIELYSFPGLGVNASPGNISGVSITINGIKESFATNPFGPSAHNDSGSHELIDLSGSVLSTMFTDIIILSDFQTIQNYPHKDTFSISEIVPYSAPVPEPAKCLFFDGADSYVEIPDAPELSGGSGKNMTVEARFFLANLPPDWMAIVQKYWNYNNKDWGLFLDKDGYVGFQKETFSLPGPQGNWQVYSSETVAVNEWNHVAFVYDNDNDIVNVYVNGVLSGSRVAIGHDLPDTDAVVSIGASGPFYQSVGDPIKLFSGYFGEVRIWDVARTEEEIFSNMLPGNITGSEEGLVAYYDFVQGEDFSILYDQIDNSNDGEIFGASWMSVCPGLEFTITITSPNGGEELIAGTIHEITWTYNGDIESVKIEYSVNNGIDWIEIVPSTENDHAFLWDIPCDLSAECLVRVSGIDEEASDRSDEVFSIIDATAPSIALTVTKGYLWPANHKLVDVGFDYFVSDNCDSEPNVSIDITSDEPTAAAPGVGDSKHAPDAEITEDGSVFLRAERSGEGDGRVYGITLTATDASGNSTSKSIYVKVNHNKKKEAIDSGQNYDAIEIN